ncbi:MAG: biopolymer transporter ExbD [Alphaproteobacteria bacterium]|nr:biopolymer transporter ExbD [Alphaproteobacteria bacterium]
MAMNVGGGGEGEVMVEMNTTPLIDVMLVLLTLLIITIPIQSHAVKLDMPRPNQAPPPTPPVSVELGVDFDGTITWDGNTATIQQLDGYLRNAATQNPQPEIHVNPNRLAKYDSVAEVLAHAQRLGVLHIGFTGVDQYN